MSKRRGFLDDTKLKVEPLYDVHGKPLVGPVNTGRAVEGSGAYTRDELVARRKTDPFARPDLETGSTSRRRV